MRVLLDTHTLIWAVDDLRKLSPTAVKDLNDPQNTFTVSVASAWEIAIKLSIHKFKLSMPLVDWVRKALTDLPAVLLPISLEHADRTVTLPFHHRDPFDRMLVAQAIVENMPVISSDPKFDAYAIRRIW